MLESNLVMLSVAVLLWSAGETSAACPINGCDCKASGTKLSCIDKGLKEIVPADSLRENTTELFISRNPITSVEAGILVGQKYRKLRKLDLYDNEIESIEKQAFGELGSLKTLNLTSNNLRVLDGKTFVGLKNLKILSLSKNKLYFINKSAFDGLSNLKKLDLSNNKLMVISSAIVNPTPDLMKMSLRGNPLICDCQLKWLVQQSFAFPGNCRFPSKLKNKNLRGVPEKDLVCNVLRLPNYSFTSGGEISFKGSQHTFTCRATWTSGMRLVWLKDSRSIPDNSRDKRTQITTTVDEESLTVTSTLHLQSLTLADQGSYVCNISRPGGYERLGTAQLHVLNPNAKICKAETARGNRGEFHWHDTVAGAVAYIPCPNGHFKPWRESWKVGTARRTCASDGVWMDAQYGDCAYESPVTQRLHYLSTTPVNKSVAAIMATRLLNISRGAKDFQNVADIIYTAGVVRRISPFIRCDVGVGARVIECISNAMNAHSSLLRAAQRESRACSSMVEVMDQYSTYFASNPSCPQNRREQVFTTENIALVIVNLALPDLFKGRTCSAIFSQEKVKTMKCVQSNNYSSSRIKSPQGASVHLPRELFYRLRQRTGRSPLVRANFQVGIFRSSKLFPAPRTGSRAVGSVASLRLRGFELNGLAHPVLVEFKTSLDEAPELVSWNHSTNGGFGSWTAPKGCNFSWSGNGSLVKCYEPTEQRYFALKTALTDPAAVRGRFSLEPIVYIGAAVCSFLIFLTLITLLLFRELRYNRDDSAMLMNECLALIVVIVAFAAGVVHTNNALMCRAVGVVLHYFLLCCLLWVGCGGVCLLRHIRTAIVPEEYNPVLRYYMISWGIPLIICGITVAGNPENYSTEGYCWLNPQPFLGAFIGPACLVLIVDIIILLRLNHRRKIIIARECNDDNRPPADGESECRTNNENEDMGTELLTPQNDDVSAMPPHGEVVDFLRGSALVLLLIIINFALGGTVIVFREPRYLNLALSCIYAVTNILLGLVIFIFHCYKKEKALDFWKSCLRSRFCARKKYLLEAEGGSDTDGPSAGLGPRDADGAAGEGAFQARIHGAQSADEDSSDAQSNVSLPSSAALTIDRVSFCVDRDENDEPETAERAPSVSDKNSCASAPLPFGHGTSNLAERPAGYRHSYGAEEKRTAPKAKTRAPLERRATPPIAGSENLTSDSHSNRAPSESAPSEKSFVRSTGEQNVSCSASEASETDGRPTRRKRSAGRLPPSDRASPQSGKPGRSRALPVVREHVLADQGARKPEAPPNSADQHQPQSQPREQPEAVQKQPLPFPGRNAYPKSFPRKYYPGAHYGLPYQGPLGQHQVPHGQAMRMPREQQVARVRPVPHDGPPNMVPVPLTIPGPAEPRGLHHRLAPQGGPAIPLQRQNVPPSVPAAHAPVVQPPVTEGQAGKQQPGQAAQQPSKTAESPRREKARGKQPSNNLLHPNSAKDQAKKNPTSPTSTPTATPKKVARVKPTPKQWDEKPSSRVATYVPVPHLKNYKSYSETSI